MTDNLARNFRDAQKQLNQIKNRPFKSKMEERMALNLASRYASDISDLTQRFRTCQGKFSRRLKARQERQKGLVSLEENSITPTHDDPFEDSMMQSQQQAVDDAFLDMREKEMNSIAKSINELNQLFRDISSFVVEQGYFSLQIYQTNIFILGTILDQIEYNVEMAAAKTESGLVELKKADNYQKKDRKMKAIFCMAITVLILLVLLFIKSQL